MVQVGYVGLRLVCPVYSTAHLVNASLVWLAFAYCEELRWNSGD